MSAPKLQEEVNQVMVEEGRSPTNTPRSSDSVSISMPEKPRMRTVGEVAPRFKMQDHWLDSLIKSAKVQEARGRRSRKQKKLKKKRSTRRK